MLKRISVKEAKEQIESGAFVLDVRQAPEFIGELGHIKGAKLIPLNELPNHLEELQNKENIIVVCRSGARSLYGASMLAQAGIASSSMDGGMISWNQEGYPVTTEI